MDIFSWDWFLHHGIWVLVTLAVVAVAYWALRHLAFKGINSLVNRITPAGKNWERASRIITRVILWLGALVIVAAVVLTILPRVGVDISAITSGLRDFGTTVGLWLGTHGVRIAIILCLGLAAHFGLKRFIPGAVERAIITKGKWREESEEELKKRSETLRHFLTGLALVVIWVMVGFMVLSEIGVSIGPLLAGAGVAGLAIGFGAQSLIRDVLNGFFIILENQYGKGDVVKTGDIWGKVEELNIRRTILRDFDGAAYVIPNGEVKTVSNYTKEWSRVHFNLSVSYGENMDHVYQVINRVGQEMAQDEYWAQFILTAPHVLGLDKFGDSGIEVKILGETKPLKQWDVMWELRKRLKKAFDEEGIEIPWPHMKLYLGDNSAKELLAKYNQLVLSSDPRTAQGRGKSSPLKRYRTPRRKFHPRQ